MKIFINDEQKVIEGRTTLFQVLSDNSLSEKKGIAVALNGSVIPRSKWGDTCLTENDKILVISATRGG